MSTQNPQDDNITLPLKTFLHLLWHEDHNQWTKVPPEIADLLVAKDPNKNNFCADESRYHVEYPSIEFPDVTTPRVWRISAWRTTYEKRVRDQRRSELWRQYRYIRDENITKLLTKIVASAPWIDTEEARNMAIRYIDRAGEDYTTQRYQTIKKSLQTMYGYTLKEYKEPSKYV